MVSLGRHLGWGPSFFFQFHLQTVEKLLYYNILHSYYVVVVYYSITLTSNLFHYSYTSYTSHDIKILKLKLYFLWTTLLITT